MYHYTPVVDQKTYVNVYDIHQYKVVVSVILDVGWQPPYRTRETFDHRYYS